jgi:Protein of unknown function (DUF1569)
MALPNIFTKEVSEQVIARIEKLTPTTSHLRGKMSVDQMLAHCCVSYEHVYEPTKHPKPNFFMGLILKWFVKGVVVSEKPYAHDGQTAPEYIITGERDFTAEKERLIAFVRQTQELGEAHFDGMESHAFGKLNKEEWNNLFYKHLDHHLMQFGV